MPLATTDIRIGSFSTDAANATGTVVIIDVFRAFTTAAVALSKGAERIVMVDDLDTARELRKNGVGRYCLGERKGIKPPGFDFGNSPVELQNTRLDGETLIQTTSNGTRGILAAGGAERIYAGSLVTAKATAQAILNGPKQLVTLVAMGENDSVRADEDEICALYLRSLLLGLKPDAKAVATTIKTMSRRRDTEVMSVADVEHCLKIDSEAFAIRVTETEGYWIATADQP
ncbi:MAG: 2-phosphosulfolactate phosphatase [Proteobacteria bacterium]|nr:2-phosphosulfolactate phosphatase [Pseudomonadota bacterium]